MEAVFDGLFFLAGNYFKTAYRSLQKNRLYAFINLTGLGCGDHAFLDRAV